MKQSKNTRNSAIVPLTAQWFETKLAFTRGTIEPLLISEPCIKATDDALEVKAERIGAPDDSQRYITAVRCMWKDVLQDFNRHLVGIRAWSLIKAPEVLDGRLISNPYEDALYHHFTVFICCEDGHYGWPASSLDAKWALYEWNNPGMNFPKNAVYDFYAVPMSFCVSRLRYVKRYSDKQIEQALAEQETQKTVTC